MTVFLDFETRSPADIKKTGAYNYAHHPQTEIAVTGFAFDQGPVIIADGPPPPVLLDRLRAGETVVAHNAGFEREMLAAKCGLRLPWEQFVDTAALAARLSLPRSLEALAEALKLPHQKDMQGHRAMLKLARPKRGWSDDEFWEEEEKPQDYMARRTYCADDVTVMREAWERLLALEPKEKQLYALTGKMNDAGVAVDLCSIPAALELLDAATSAGESEFKSIVGHPVKSYANVAKALGLPNVKKVTVRNALKDDGLPPSTRRALELFKRLARSSPAKLTALQRRTSIDSRVRGALIYCGAERTGRWSSGGVQLHNLPRGLGEGTDEAFDALAAGVLDVCYDDPVGTIAEALRGFFTGPLVVGDFAQIEARMLNWLAGQEDIVELFRRGEDVYSYTASKIFGRSITKKSVDDSLPDGVTPRFVGKTAELGAGYGLGAEKFRRSLDEVFDVQVSMEFAARVIGVYRASHAKVCAFWRRLEQGFQYVIQAKKDRVKVTHNISMGMTKVGGLPFAWIELPSGRWLYYAEPEMTADGVRYWGRNIYKGGQWDRVSTYGGKLAENITQAASRDVLADAMIRLDEAGFNLVLQVHDEVVADISQDNRPDLQNTFKGLMLRSPSWAAGLPIDVECFTCSRYRK